MIVGPSQLNEYGVRSEFFRRYDSTVSYYQELATRVQSNSNKEEYRFLGAAPQLREWVDGRRTRGIFHESYDIENLKYESTVLLPRDLISDDQTGQIMMRINDLAQRAAVHKDRLLCSLLTAGEAAESLCYDGKPFFATDHECRKSGASQSNKLAFDISTELSDEPDTPDRPGILTLQTAFDDALAAMLGFLDSQAEPMALSDRGLYVVCHSSLKIRWLTALQAAFVGSTQNVRDQMDVKVISMPWLTDKSKWYLLKVDEPTRPFIFQLREDLEFRLVGGGSELEFLNDQWMAGCRARYAMAYGRWEFAVRVDFE